MCLSVLENFSEYKGYNIQSLCKTEEEILNQNKYVNIKEEQTSKDNIEEKKEKEINKNEEDNEIEVPKDDDEIDLI